MLPGMSHRTSSRAAAVNVYVEAASERQRRAALELALGAVGAPASQSIIDRAYAEGQRAGEDWRGLLVARIEATGDAARPSSDDAVVGAILVRILAGRVASVGAPRVISAAPDGTAAILVQCAADFSQDEGAVLAQSLLECDDASNAAVFAHAGFEHPADLLFLAARCDEPASDVPSWQLPPAVLQPISSGLSWLPYGPETHRRFADLVERTYIGSRDCPALDGLRPIDDVLAGYRVTGEFSPQRWLIAVRNGCDVGCLLLADHAADDQWELVYLGVVPEARGQGLGLAMVRHALELARRAGRRQLVLAVDAANAPAIAIYERAGFEALDRRAIYLRRFDKPREM